MLDVDVLIVLFGPEGEGSVVQAPLRVCDEPFLLHRERLARAQAFPAGAAPLIGRHVEREEGLTGRRERLAYGRMDPVKIAVETGAAGPTERFEVRTGVVELDDHGALPGGEGSVQERQQIARASLGKRESPDL